MADELMSGAVKILNREIEARKVHPQECDADITRAMEEVVGRVSRGEPQGSGMREALFPADIVEDGGKCITTLDAGYNLQGALYDIKRLRAKNKAADQVCIDTIERVVAQIEEARAALSQSPPAEINHYETTKAGIIDWKMEAERANRLLAAVQSSPAGALGPITTEQLDKLQFGRSLHERPAWAQPVGEQPTSGQHDLVVRLRTKHVYGAFEIEQQRQEAADEIVRRRASMVSTVPFYGATCPTYPNCTGGCGLGCRQEIESQAKEPEASGGLCGEASHAVRVGVSGADQTATSERMDVTSRGGENPALFRDGHFPSSEATVAVPQSALDWLFGIAPDADGKEFGECETIATPLSAIFPRPKYWWRSKFRSMIPALSGGPGASPGTPQGRCDITLTERFANPACQCKTYAGNKGPCKLFEEGENGNCVYCDHNKACHEALPQDAATVRDEWCNEYVALRASSEEEIRDLKRALGAVVMAAGGEVRVTKDISEIIQDIELSTWREDHGYVYRSTFSRPERK